MIVVTHWLRLTISLARLPGDTPGDGASRTVRSDHAVLTAK